MDEHGFGDAVKKGQQKVCDEDRQALIDKFSLCNSILDLPPEVVLAILRINPKDAWMIGELANLAGKVKVESPEQMVELLDLARVARIMEEQQMTARMDRAAT